MAERSAIEWCDATFNPWWGCEKVSPGCAHCYAERDSKRYGYSLFGVGHEYRFFGDAHWDQPLRWARRLPAKLGRRPRVFCASMADVFEVRRDLSETRYRLFALMAATPELDWLVLTKRPEHALDLLTSPWWWARVEGTAQRIHEERTGEDVSMTLAIHGPLPNVWLGVSIENARHTWRADVLREIPAAVRFVSAEPLLGSLFTYGPSVAANDQIPPNRTLGGAIGDVPPAKRPLDLTGIDWLIVGAESGPGARAMDENHVRELRAACAEKGIAFFYKQNAVNGRKVPLPELDGRQWTEMPLALLEAAS